MITKKWFLYATEFLCGMAVMAIELGASRLLAPYFSSSQIVWTIIIGTIMIALAVGNVIGGKLADKDPNPSKLYIRLLIASVWTAGIPFFGKYIIILVSLVLALVSGSGFLILASLISCMLIFVFPLILLGTVTPCLVKYTVKTLEESGKTVGMLEALNTIGSIIGTFIPTFLTIPAVGTNWTFIIFSIIIFTLCAVYFISSRTKLIKTSICFVLIVAFSICANLNGFAFWDSTQKYEGESIYNYLRVYEENDKTILSTNVLFGQQSVLIKGDKLTGMYYDYALAAPFMSDMIEKEDKSLLILGLGAGTYATQCIKYIDKEMTIDGVEIDEDIVKLAEEYFSLPSTVNSYVFDGRAFLTVGEGKTKKYDVIMVDAYQDITIPFQMSSVEFFKIVKSHLNENGVMVVNMNMYSDELGSINNYLIDTIGSVYGYASSVKCGTNRVLYASDNKDYLDNFNSRRQSVENEELKNFFERLSSQIEICEKGDKILTDDKAPVELLGINLIDKMISEELSYWKEYLKDHSIFDLYKELT